jgi:hypothetical protein
VIRAEQTQTNPEANRIAREKECQKEKETFEQWMKDQIRLAEENLAKKMEEQAAHRGIEILSNPRARRETKERLEGWASQVPPNLPELPPSVTSKAPSPPPPSPPKSNQHNPHPSSSSSSSSSSSDKDNIIEVGLKVQKEEKGRNTTFK